MFDLDPGAAIEGWFSLLSSLPPQKGGVLLLKDVVSDRGWRCDRYIQLLMIGLDTNPVPGLKFRLRRLKIDDGVRHMVSHEALDAFEWWCGINGMKVEEVRRDCLVKDEESGVVMAPHLVVKYKRRFWEGGSWRSSTFVIQIKSIEDAEWESRQTKRGYSPKKKDMRRLLAWGEMLEADKASFLLVRTTRPYKARTHPIGIEDRIMPFIRDRVGGLRLLTDLGDWGEKTSLKSYCKDCPLSVACKRADREERIGGGGGGNG